MSSRIAPKRLPSRVHPERVWVTSVHELRLPCRCSQEFCSVNDLNNMSVLTPGDDDRRRSPRFSCTGEARIARLPSNGLFLPARIRDLSLGGCCVETPSALECGARTEMVVRVNSAMFRAVSQVKAIRDGAKLSMEFVQLSARGRDNLTEVIEQLARLQALLGQLRSPRRAQEAEELLRELERVGFRAVPLCRTSPLSSSVPGRERCEDSVPRNDSEARMEEGKARIVPLDLFV
jgi:hypothetical protein